MNTEQYRDCLHGLSCAIASFTSCLKSERQAEADRLMRHWESIASAEQPRRLGQRDKDKCDNLLHTAARLLNEWHIESQAMSEN